MDVASMANRNVQPMAGDSGERRALRAAVRQLVTGMNRVADPVQDGGPALRSARLKVELLAQGLRVWPNVEPHLEAHGKPLLRVRSGSCGGLDLILPGGIVVNCPVREPFALGSQFELRLGAGGLLLTGPGPWGEVKVRLVACPDYYAHRTASGRPMRQVGQLCSDRLGIGLTNGCAYWAAPERRCRFCSIGLNVRTGHEIGSKPLGDILDVVAAAADDPVAPARHMLLGGGTPPGADAGAGAIARAARAIKQRWPRLPIYAMIAAPDDLDAIDDLISSGVDELGINVELFSPAAAAAYVPGKHAVGLAHYLDALTRAVSCYAHRPTAGTPASAVGEVGRVRSITVVGLEPAEETLAGVGLLARLGVMPILTPFRPMTNTPMEDHPRWPGEQLWELCTAATSVAGAFGMPLGPTCIPCQANTLNVSGHPTYRAY
jgi:hypothetical protein